MPEITFFQFALREAPLWLGSGAFVVLALLCALWINSKYDEDGQDRRR